MKPPEKYVSPLSDDDVIFLENVVKKDSNFRVRTRAHIILLSFKGFCIDDISEIFDLNRDTVSSCISSWENSGRDGLADRPKCGRPPGITSSDMEALKKIIGEAPQTVRHILARLEEETGKKISRATLKRISEKLNLNLPVKKKRLKTEDIRI